MQWLWQADEYPSRKSLFAVDGLELGPAATEIVP
jgi:hypothetical protein